MFAIFRCERVTILLLCVVNVGVDNWAGTSDSVPATVVVHVCASDGASAVSYSEDVWEWFGVTMPVVRDFWSGHMLKTSMVFFTGQVWPWRSCKLASFFLGRDPYVEKMDAWIRCHPYCDIF